MFTSLLVGHVSNLPISEDVDVDSQTPPPPKVQTNGRSSRSKTKSQLPAHSRSKNGARTPVEGDWEVDCEICQRYGVNIVRLSAQSPPSFSTIMSGRRKAIGVLQFLWKVATHTMS